MDSEEPVPKRQRRRYQRGSLQKRRSGGHWVWIGFWRDEEGRRHAKTLGSCRDLSRPDAEAQISEITQPLNALLGDLRWRQWKLKAFIEECYLPFSRRRWKRSTRETSESRIRHHLIGEFGMQDLATFQREQLQQYLDEKTAAGLSFSTVAHLRWDLRAIFRLAQQDGILTLSPAESLFVAGSPSSRSSSQNA